jgi:hypothetical protein
MDIITTGVAKSSPERIKAICDLIRNLYVRYFLYFCYILYIGTIQVKNRSKRFEIRKLI